MFWTLGLCKCGCDASLCYGYDVTIRSISLKLCSLVSKLTAEMLASLFRGLETCATQALCIRGVCAAEDDATCPFLNSFNLLCMLGAHITMPYTAGILNYGKHIPNARFQITVLVRLGSVWFWLVTVLLIVCPRSLLLCPFHKKLRIWSKKSFGFCQTDNPRSSFMMYCYSTDFTSQGGASKWNPYRKWYQPDWRYNMHRYLQARLVHMCVEVLCLYFTQLPCK